MSQVVVGDLMGEHAAKLLIVRPVQESRGHVELAVACAASRKPAVPLADEILGTKISRKPETIATAKTLRRCFIQLFFFLSFVFAAVLLAALWLIFFVRVTALVGTDPTALWICRPLSIGVLRASATPIGFRLTSTICFVPFGLGICRKSTSTKCQSYKR